MARSNKNHDKRRIELLPSAQKLFYSKGYEATTVEDIIQDAGISKGAFYHYFSSKGELLDCLVMQMSQQIIDILQSIFDDPDLSALEKFRKSFTIGLRIKTDNKELLKTWLKMIYQDQNLVLRYKMNKNAIEMAAPLYSSLISQGKAEGIFNTPSPEFAAGMMMTMGIGIQESIQPMMAEIDEKPENVGFINRQIELYTDAVERLLGAPNGCLNLVTEADIRALC